MSSIHPSREVLADMLRERLKSGFVSTPQELFEASRIEEEYILDAEEADLGTLLITSPIAQIGIKIVKYFEMAVNTRYEHNGYIWFSNGTYEVSLRFMNEEVQQVLRDIIVPEWEASKKL